MFLGVFLGEDFEKHIKDWTDSIELQETKEDEKQTQVNDTNTSTTKIKFIDVRIFVSLTLS